MQRYTVRTLSDEIDRLVGGRLGDVVVEGEVGQLATPRSGHRYLVLRDADASINAVVWRTTWRGLRYHPKEGDRVVCRGRVGLYAARGAIQLYVKQILRSGEGELARMIQERKARLAADGLLDPGRKRPLPASPEVVGVATSLTGAALQDFLKVSGARYPAARVLVAGCTVQGQTAAAEVVRAVELLVEDGRAEVIVVTRGGGSREDLLPFQDEALARALAACPVPVVSAVGHQVDTTLADLVADAVAPTPSAAAALVLPDGPALTQRVDEAADTLERGVLRMLQARRQHLRQVQARVRSPEEHMALARSRAEALQERLERSTQGMLDRRRQHLGGLAGRLQALSPLAVLGRGYAIALGPEGVVSDPAQVSAGDALLVKVHGGDIPATVS